MNRRDADSSIDHHTAATTVRPASNKWGCAYSRCLNAARFVVKGPDGYEYGACAAHVRAVKGIANAR